MANFGGLAEDVTRLVGPAGWNAISGIMGYGYTKSQIGPDNNEGHALDAMNNVINGFDYVTGVDSVIEARQLEILRQLDIEFERSFERSLFGGRNNMLGAFEGRMRFWEGKVRLGDALRKEGWGRGRLGRGMFAEGIEGRAIAGAEGRALAGVEGRLIGEKLASAAVRRELFWSRVGKVAVRAIRYIR